MIAHTPPPPYYAVIFTSDRTEGDQGYNETAKRMLELARQQPDFLGVEFAREEIGITISYWKDLDSIYKWKDQSEHTLARNKGRQAWYKAFTTRIALVEKDYTFMRG